MLWLQWLILIEMIVFALIINRHYPAEEFHKEKEALLEDTKKKPAASRRKSAVAASAFV